MALSFLPDRQFPSLIETLQFIERQYLLELPRRVWRTEASGLLTPRLAPNYLFRGECGDFPTTVATWDRPDVFALRDGSQRRLARSDKETLKKLLDALVWEFTRENYGLDTSKALGLLQHYGLPTRMMDFTFDLKCAATFAGHECAKIGRICVLPLASIPDYVDVVDLMSHEWAERPQRQNAYAIVLPRGYCDLKNPDVRSKLRLKWYEFPVSVQDAFHTDPWRDELIRLDNDPSAGFLRHHITEYVESFGKFSPTLTDWLLERVPSVPRCAEVYRFEDRDVVLRHRPPSYFPLADEGREQEMSRRYWSKDHPDSSWERMTKFEWPAVGAVYADPRTYHGPQSMS